MRSLRWICFRIRSTVKLSCLWHDNFTMNCNLAVAWIERKRLWIGFAMNCAATHLMKRQLQFTERECARIHEAQLQFTERECARIGDKHIEYTTWYIPSGFDMFCLTAKRERSTTMKNNKLLTITVTVTLLYCCLCFISSGCILYGSFHESNSMFQFGNSLVYFWLFNPIAIILSLIGFIQNLKTRGYFILCAILSIISWIVAGSMIATVFW